MQWMTVSRETCFLLLQYAVAAPSIGHANLPNHDLSRPVHTENNNYKDNDISAHTSERYCLFILSMHICRFKFLSSLWQDWFWLAVNVFIVHQLEKNRSESNSNDIVSLCLYRYICGVDAAIL